MTQLICLIKRNSKLFFKDIGMFITALLTPLILLVLYVSFLAEVYKDSFALSIPAGFTLSEGILDAAVGAQLFASLLAVSCITVSFCSNMLIVQDKANGTQKDLLVSPIPPSKLALGYYLSTLISTLIISAVACVVSFIYLAIIGWYFTVLDILLIFFDIFLLVMFGTALSSTINFFLSTQGQISAVGTIVSAGYGFISGAYMPISQLGDGLQKVIMFLPGTYGTSLLKNHCMRGVLAKMSDEGIPADVIESIMDSIDCNLYFFDSPIDIPMMYLIIIGSIIALMAIYIILNVKCKKTR